MFNFLHLCVTLMTTRFVTFFLHFFNQTSLKNIGFDKIWQN